MIKPTTHKRTPPFSTAIQHLAFQQGVYFKNEDVQEKHGELVNLVYDMQNWPLFQKKVPDTLEDRVAQMTSWFGKPNQKKKLQEKGDTYIWIIEVNGSVYSLFQCSYAFFMEGSLKTPFEKTYEDVKVIAGVMFEKAKHKPRELRKK